MSGIATLRQPRDMHGPVQAWGVAIKVLHRCQRHRAVKSTCLHQSIFLASNQAVGLTVWLITPLSHLYGWLLHLVKSVCDRCRSGLFAVCELRCRKVIMPLPGNSPYTRH